jgi:hypothetical protein
MAYTNTYYYIYIESARIINLLSKSVAKEKSDQLITIILLHLWKSGWIRCYYRSNTIAITLRAKLMNVS